MEFLRRALQLFDSSRREEIKPASDPLDDPLYNIEKKLEELEEKHNAAVQQAAVFKRINGEYFAVI